MKRVQILVYGAVALVIVGAIIDRPPTNCIAICWFPEGKTSFISLRRYGFVIQNRRAVNNRPYGFLRYCSLNSNFCPNGSSKINREKICKSY